MTLNSIDVVSFHLILYYNKYIKIHLAMRFFINILLLRKITTLKLLLLVM